MWGGVLLAGLPLWCLLLGTVAGTEVESCSHPNTTLCQKNKCALIDDDTVFCCHIRSDFELKECLGRISKNITNIKALYVYNASYDTLDVSVSKIFTLNVVSVTGGKLKRIHGEVHNTATCLNFSDNSIAVIDDKIFSSVSQLKTLDLSRNNLSSLPSSVRSMKNFSLDISGNDNIWCKDLRQLLNATKSDPIYFMNVNNTNCLGNKTFHWFNATDKYPLRVLETFAKVEQTCPNMCKCDVTRFIYIGHAPSVSVFADCSNQQLTELPPNMPQNTYILNVSNNNITSLGAFSSDHSYETIREFYADNNHITSIGELEGTKFISNFSVLSLRNNKITTVPIYFLSDTFSRNLALRKVNLAGNKLSCECNTALTLKAWFLSNKKHMEDIHDVMCANLPRQVIELDMSEVCVTRRVISDYINYIIGAEVALLLFLISKVSYDYWVFKTSGYLPWPAYKLPKLPCDWVFES